MNNVLVFAVAPPGGPFALVLIGGLLVALGYALLVRRWPPTTARAAAFALALGLSLAALSQVLRVREVRIDVAAREVVDSVRVLGWERARRDPFSHFRVLWVQPVSAVPTRADEQGPRYGLSLESTNRSLQLRDFADALEAERFARVLAPVGGWEARRRGYTVQVGGPVTEGLAAGEFHRIQTPSGRQALAIDLERWVRIIPAPGQTSPIAPEDPR